MNERNKRPVILIVLSLAAAWFGWSVQADEPRKSRSNGYGDPLPDGAQLRLGTLRLRHQSSLNAVASSPDGSMLASSGWDEFVRLWDSQTGKPLRELANGKRAITFGIAFSPDSSKLASVTERGSVHLFDVKNGKALFEKIPPKAEQVYGVAFAPDGKTFASAGAGFVRVWNAQTGAEVHVLAAPGEQDSHAVVYSPDGKLLVSTAGPTIRVWDVASGTSRLVISKAHGHDVSAIAFIDTKTLVSAGYGYKDISKEAGTPAVTALGEVRFWDITSGKQTDTLKEEASDDPGRRTIAVSADCKCLAVASPNNIRLWHLPALKPVRELKGYHNNSVFRGSELTFSPDGRRLAAISARDQTVRIWDVATGKLVFDPADSHTERLASVAYFGDGRKALTASADSIRVWDMRTGMELRRIILGTNMRVKAAALSPDGKTIAAAGWRDDLKTPLRGVVKLWAVETGQEIVSHELDGRVASLVFSPDGNSLAVGTFVFPLPGQAKKASVSLWDRGKQKWRLDLEGPFNEVRYLVFSPDGKTLTSVDRVGSTQTVDVGTGKLGSRTAIPAEMGLHSAILSKDGKTLFTSADFSPQIVVTELATKHERRRIVVPKTFGGPMALSPDGYLLATASQHVSGGSDKCDFALHLWDLLTGAEVGKLHPGSATVAALAFSPDGKRLISGLDNGTALVWNLGATLQSTVPSEKLNRELLDRLWIDLGDKDGVCAYRAVFALAADPVESLAFLKDCCKPVASADPVLLDRLIADLDSPAFETRQRATEKLGEIGDLAEPALRKMLKAELSSLEVRRRIDRILAEFDTSTRAEHRQVIHAVQVLEYIGTPEAEKLLAKLASGAPTARLTREAKAALSRRTAN